MKIALTTTGGIGGVIFLVIAYRKQRLGEAADRRDDLKLRNERFDTAAKQLGHASPAVRLAGVYAMAGLADDWPENRQTCLDVLCAYVRMHREPAPPGDPAERSEWHGDRQVRQTIMRVVAAHLRTDAAVSWQGHDFDFTGAVVDGADFTGAVFSGGLVRFYGAVFTGDLVSFYRAVFSGGMVTFARATFDGVPVTFAEARVDGGVLEFPRAMVNGGTISFQDADFVAGQVRFRRVRFAGGVVEFPHAAFDGADVLFPDAEFAGGTVDLGEPASWAAPPVFDVWPDGAVPEGLRLPRTD
ncbi:MAG TPA: pentapeptide repeat-containing protein [Streptosporangiaceae bacterium]